MTTRAPASNEGRMVRVSRAFLPFADAASDQLPLPRLLRLSLFQVSVGIVTALLTGSINRVMIVELAVPASLVATMVALPLVFAPFRALIGHKSDNHVSHIGWRRGPYIWFGGLLQFGGLAIMPFALLVISQTPEAAWIGMAGGALAFLLVGAGMHTTQTSGLALATDIAPDADRPKVVALLYVMLLVGMAVGAGMFGIFLSDFTELKLIKVIQGTAVVVIALNVIALWKQEAPNAELTAEDRPRESFAARWAAFIAQRDAKRILAAIGVGAAGFAMQDVLLEPFGAEVLGLSVSQTTLLTAIFAIGTICGFGLAARQLQKGAEPFRLAGAGAILGVLGFTAIVLSAPLGSAFAFRVGVFIIGLGGGVFSVCTLTAIMDLAKDDASGIALGAWGAVQATCAGAAIAIGGGVRDILSSLAVAGQLGPALADKSVGYVFVYHVEILLLFVSLAIIGPLARYAIGETPPRRRGFNLSAFPQ
ncbi:MAG: MFS transporter [Alphaproteobacteria bacterium]|nr:MFS transporter [Alphaproteobacteria bacterium]